MAPGFFESGRRGEPVSRSDPSEQAAKHVCGFKSASLLPQASTPRRHPRFMDVSPVKKQLRDRANGVVVAHTTAAVGVWFRSNHGKRRPSGFEQPHSRSALRSGKNDQIDWAESVPAAAGRPKRAVAAHFSKPIVSRPAGDLYAPQSLAIGGLHGPPLRREDPFVSVGGQGKAFGHIWSRRTPLGVSCVA